MSSASVTAPMRVHGWNVHLLASPSDFHFAGLYQPELGTLTFLDLLNEIRLCFDIPGFEAETRACNARYDPWERLAFFLADVNRHVPRAWSNPEDCPIYVNSEDFKRLYVPAPLPVTPENPGEAALVRYHLVRHSFCLLSTVAPLAEHLEAGCAKHIPRPVRRRDPRYLPLDMPSPDPRIAPLPLRRTMRTRGRSASPGKDAGPEDTDCNGCEESLAGMVAPPGMDLTPDLARQTIAAFRASCLVAARQCAVSGKGRSWCANPAIGPGLRACQIVPQQHYHLCPDDGGDDGGDEAKYSPRRLREAWQRTWSAENGILLLSHLRELFEARLLSIDPGNLSIRAFVPYDVITIYNWESARLPPGVDRNALRLHYDMCCIENMAAKMPLMDPPPGADGSGPASSGPTPASPLNSGARGPATPDVAAPPGAKRKRRDADDPQPAQGGGGDPPKRARSTHDGSDEGGEEAMPVLTDDGLPQMSASRSRPTLDRAESRANRARASASGVELPEMSFRR